MFRKGFAQGITLVVTAGIVIVVNVAAAQFTVAHAAELLEFEFERKQKRYEVSSVAYIDVPPAGVYAVLTDYAALHRISNLVVESTDLGTDKKGQQLVYTLNEGCLAMFCRSLKKVERLQAVPFELIITDALPEQSDVAFSHSEWQLHREGRGTRLEYRMSTDINFWVPPVIGDFVLSRWLKKGAANAVVRIEYFAWHALYGAESGAANDETADETARKTETKK